MPNISSLTTEIIAYESGELSPQQTLELFSKLIKSGMAWKLQGHYGRNAMDYINAGYIDRSGNILKNIEENDSEA